MITERSKLLFFGWRKGLRLLMALIILTGGLHISTQPTLAGTLFNIIGPPGSSDFFGTYLSILPNGNIVIADPYYDGYTGADIGAVYLYNGATGAQISMLTGATPGDRIGYSVTVLPGGNFVASSPFWDYADKTDAGAVTWINGVSGLSGMVWITNSLVGSWFNDQVGGHGGVIVLSNGNYLVKSVNWTNRTYGNSYNAGAVTWGSGSSGIAGIVSPANSLVGWLPNDGVGSGGITLLNNGNYVVQSPSWDSFTASDVGAATWGNGMIGTSGEISSANSLVGSKTNDNVGSGLVIELSNGNYLVQSQYWTNGSATNAGAVTWGNGMSGVAGEVSAINSLVGSTVNDQVGSCGLIGLSNGNYVVGSCTWDNAAAVNAGAVTWANGIGGISGVISSTNSLVGSTANDSVGSVAALPNGNYVARSPSWDNTGVIDCGAITWGNGASGTTGAISAANSLLGGTAGDKVGYDNITVLSNGNYLVRSRYWDNGGNADVGAITWVSGTSIITGTVSAANSLIGNTANDKIGWDSPTALSNGSYLVRSPYWDNGSAANAGAITWGDGTGGITGTITVTNSLVGSTANDKVGECCIYELTNGNYVVNSLYWDNAGVIDAGAVTWGDGSNGVAGVISALNSLTGSSVSDQIGYKSVKVLSNGNYVVNSPDWDNGGAIDAGAVTWGDGSNGTTGVVSAANSLVGSATGDRVGNYGVTVLSSGNYIVSSPDWGNGIFKLGAVTWGNGASGVVGAVSATNSLLGAQPGDQVGNSGVIELSNGNYVVSSPGWNFGGIIDAGAVTWGNGNSGVTGMISAANSLVGSADNDQVGYGIFSLSNGDYVVKSPKWNNSPITDGGAVTWGMGFGGAIGLVNGNNSVLGTQINGGTSMSYWYDAFNNQLVVGRSKEKMVTIFKLYTSIYLPLLIR